MNLQDASEPPGLAWSARLAARIDDSLTGDRMHLPPSVLDALVGQTQLLPSPLTFQLRATQPQSDAALCTHGVVREFTAPEDVVMLSPFLAHQLKISFSDSQTPSDAVENQIESNQTVTVKLVMLPKCTFARLAPLDAQYASISTKNTIDANMDLLRSMLESFLRRNHATLTMGETLNVKELAPPYRVHSFIIVSMEPAPACVCVDTDMAVDVTPLDRNVAEQVAKTRLFGQAIQTTNANHVNADAASTITIDAGSDSRDVDIKWMSASSVTTESVSLPPIQLKESQKLYARVPRLAQTSRLRIQIDMAQGDVDVYVSLITERPHRLDHDWFDVGVGNVDMNLDLNAPTSSDSPKTAESEQEQETSPFVYVAVVACTESAVFRVRMFASSAESAALSEFAPKQPLMDEVSPDKDKCDNCGSMVPRAAMPTHTAFCHRNNRKCPECNQVFKKEDFGSHWHCVECDYHGHVSTQTKHTDRYHTSMKCECGDSIHLPLVSHHRRHECAYRSIMCRFCHLRVRAGLVSRNAKDLYLGLRLTEHESECGSRTISCQKCGRHVQLKDVQTHAKYHDHERKLKLKQQDAQIPKLCANCNCSANVSESSKNVMQVCVMCFSRFWSSTHDPGHQKLLHKMMTTYHEQLTRGCGSSSCYNRYCATSLHEESSKSPLPPTDAAVLALDLIKKSFVACPDAPQYYFCVTDASNSKRRYVAETVLVPLGFRAEWCVKALKETNDDVDRAAAWLVSNAPNPSAP